MGKTENFIYKSPVPVDFGAGKRKTLSQLLETMQLKKGLLISAPSMVRGGIAKELAAASNGRIVAIFSDIQPNPTLDVVDHCADVLRQHHCEFAVALGGGSVLDCAKAACFISQTPHRMGEFLESGQSVDKAGIPLIAMPTTSGTASEVTAASVLTDEVNDVKRLLISDYFYPAYALIDPELTYSCPPAVTAASGLDVLTHALEAYYGRKHQPFTDMAAIRSASLVFHYLLQAYHDPENKEARDQMSLASVTAGLAFGNTSTAAAHACSYPLTQHYGIPHGEACAFTLPSFWRINSIQGPEGTRLQQMSSQLGFEDASELAGRIDQMKEEMGMRITLKEVGIDSDDALDALVANSFAPNMANNPVEMTKRKLKAMYLRLDEKMRLTT